MPVWDDRIKEVSSTCIDMAILKNGGGKFSLDDGIGWRWSGDDESFLLGILRVGGSIVADEFYKKLDASNVTKSDMKRAILHSLDKDPKDGLYSLIGDNGAYEGGAGEGEQSNQQYEIEECLQESLRKRYVEDAKEKARKISWDVVEKITEKVPGDKEIFEDYENELAKNYSGGKSWGHFVKNNIIKGCDHEVTAKDFIKCVYDALEQEKDDIREGFYEHHSNAFRGALSISYDDLKEIAEEHSIPFKAVELCADDFVIGHTYWNSETWKWDE